jgi:hypothetical protein
MYDFTCLSHIVGGFILRVGMRVWVVCTHTRTRLPDGYMMMLIYVPAGRNIIPYPSTYRVKLVGYSGFRYPLPSLVGVLAKLSGTSATNLQLNYSPAGAVQGWQQGGAGRGRGTAPCPRPWPEIKSPPWPRNACRGHFLPRLRFRRSPEPRRGPRGDDLCTQRKHIYHSQALRGKFDPYIQCPNKQIK